MANQVEFRSYPRAKWHQYCAGIYFVTCCTWNKKHQFGEVVDGMMILNVKGRIVAESITTLSVHYPDLEVHNHIVMPNHIHLLLQIVPSGSGHRVVRPYCNFGAVHASLHDDADIPFELRSHFNSRLSVIIGGLKSGTSRRIHSFDRNFKWQRSFHDHLVRNQRSYNNITTYITENPQRWDADTFNM